MRQKMLFEVMMSGTPKDDATYPALSQTIGKLRESIHSLEEVLEDMHNTLFMNKLAQYPSDSTLMVSLSFLNLSNQALLDSFDSLDDDPLGWKKTYR